MDLAAPAAATSEEGNNLLLVNLPDLEIPTRLEKKVDGSNNWQCPFQIKASTKTGKEILCEFHLKVCKLFNVTFFYLYIYR